MIIGVVTMEIKVPAIMIEATTWESCLYFSARTKLKTAGGMAD
jgi:hypothetical protein